MARLDSWLSPGMTHVLGWALVHSLWQCLACAALAAVAMAFSRRPQMRYGIAVGVLMLMLAAPVATFFLLMKTAAPLQILHAENPGPVQPLPSGFSPTRVVMPAPIAAIEHRVVLAAEERGQTTNILPWLVTAWLCGVVFFAMRLAGAILLLERNSRSQSVPLRPSILAVCHALQVQLGLTRAVAYLECNWLDVPAVIGWLRPVIFLPAVALSGLSEDQLRAVIAHELAHIRRLDPFVNLFQMLAETLLFYHPAIWWLNRRIRAERELCCDEIAVWATGNRLEYARTLALMAQWERAPILAMAANRGYLTERVLHILGRKPARAGQRVLGLTGSVLFLATALSAANVLLGIAYPVPAAHAKEAFGAVLASSQTAIVHAVHRLVPAVEPAAVPANKEVASVKPARGDAAPEPERLAAPSIDLSHLVPAKAVPTPDLPAPNDAAEKAAIPVAQPSSRASSGLSTESGGASQKAASLLSTPAGNSTAANVPFVTQCRNASVFGRVISATAVQMQGFTCFAGANDNIVLGACPLASTDSAHRDECPWDVALNVQLAEPADAARMAPGKVVRLAGNFRVIRQGESGHVAVSNARILFLDYYWGRRSVLACGAPQLAALSRDIGLTVCVEKEILDDLGAKGAALAASAHAPVAKMDAILSANPDAISCARSNASASTATRASPPPAMNCAYNSYWIWASARGRPAEYGGVAPYFEPQPPAQTANPTYPYIHF